jgi:hypothetical protein
VIGGLLFIGAVALFLVLRRRPKSEPSTATEFPHYIMKDSGIPKMIQQDIRPEKQVVDEFYAGGYETSPARPNAKEA